MDKTSVHCESGKDGEIDQQDQKSRGQETKNPSCRRPDQSKVEGEKKMDSPAYPFIIIVIIIMSLLM